MDKAKKDRLEESFRILAIFKLPWNDIKNLDDDEREFFLEKAEEVEQQVMAQAKMMSQQGGGNPPNLGNMGMPQKV